MAKKFFVDLKFSIAALFNIAPTQTGLQMLTALQTEDHDALIDSITAIFNSSAASYYPRYAGFTMNGVKKSGSRRILFLTDHQSGRIIILADLDIKSREHTDARYLQYAEQAVRRLADRFQLALDVVTIHDDDKYQPEGEQAVTIVPPPFTIDEEPKLAGQDIQKLTLDARQVNKTGIETAFMWLLSVDYTKEQLEKFIDYFRKILTRDNINLYLTINQNCYTVAMQFGTGKTYYLRLNKNKKSRDFFALFTSGPIYIALAEQHQAAYQSFLLQSFICNPDEIFHLLRTGLSENFQIKREHLQGLFDNILYAVKHAEIKHDHFATFLKIILTKNLINYLDERQRQLLLEQLFTIAAAERAFAETIIDKQLILILFHTSLTFINHRVLMSWIERAHDIMTLDMLKPLLAPDSNLSFHQQLSLLLQWATFSTPCDTEINQAFSSFHQRYLNLNQDERLTCTDLFIRHRILLQDTIFKNELPPIPLAPIAIVNDQDHTAKPHKGKPKNDKPTLDNFKKLADAWAQKKALTQTDIQNLQKLLNAFMFRGRLNLPIDINDYMLDTFFIHLKTHCSYNIIELVAQFPMKNLLSLLCEFANDIDPKLLHQHNRRALLVAVKSHRYDNMRILVEHFAYDPNFADKNGFTPLIMLIQTGSRLQTVTEQWHQNISLLIHCGANINHKNFEGVTALLALATGHFQPKTFALLLKAGANPNDFLVGTNTEHISVLDIVLGHQKPLPEIEKLLICHGAIMSRGPTQYTSDNAHITDERRRTGQIRSYQTVHITAGKRQQKIENQLHQLLSDVVNNKISGMSALKIIKNSHFTVNFNVKGFSLLHKAIIDVNIELFDEIINHHNPNLALNITDTGLPVSLGTYLHVAIASGKTDFVPTLLEHGCPVGAYDLNGLAPIHVAVAHGDMTSIMRLYHYGADPTQKLKNGESMQDYCRRIHNGEILKILINMKFNRSIDISNHNLMIRQCALYGDPTSVLGYFSISSTTIDVNSTSLDEEKNTALIQACRHRSTGCLGVALILLARGADPSIANTRGETPLQLLTRGRPPEDPEENTRFQLVMQTCMTCIAQKQHLPSGGVLVYDGNGQVRRFENEAEANDAAQATAKGADYLVQAYRPF